MEDTNEIRISQQKPLCLSWVEGLFDQTEHHTHKKQSIPAKVIHLIKL